MVARLLALVLSLTVFRAATAGAEAAPPPPVDYADQANWLCLPGRATDACGRSDQDATVLRADGAMTIERFHADPKAPIDCFYVYPTVSLDPGGNATMKVEREEIAVVNQQFARFGAVCRTFAPLYRQATLTALRSNLAGHPVAVDRELPYNDIKAAWDYYLAHDNHGRGVVLIGHSQGSLVLDALVKREVDGKPVQGRVLSIVLAGYFLQVPVGKDVGGDFQSIPLCRAPDQIHCVMNFASYRVDVPPPASARFGASFAPGMEAACTDPAALSGGEAPLHAYLASGVEAVTGDGLAPGSWTNPPQKITTPFVEVPGMLSAQCVHENAHHYLAVTVHPSHGARTDELVGDVVIKGKRLDDWGLHRIDMNLTMAT
jgi:hypothetical protein